MTSCEKIGRTLKLSPALKLSAFLIDFNNDADDMHLDTWSVCDAVALSHASSGGKALLLGPGRFINVSGLSAANAPYSADGEAFVQPESGVGTVRTTTV